MAKRNMYECLPCPKCGSEYRACYPKTMTQDCDDCGFTEPYDDHQREEFGVVTPRTPAEQETE
jgi:hypothetical protein